MSTHTTCFYEKKVLNVELWYLQGTKAQIKGGVTKYFSIGLDKSGYKVRKYCLYISTKKYIMGTH